MFYRSKKVTTQDEIDFAFEILGNAIHKDKSLLDKIDSQEMLNPVFMSEDGKWVTFVSQKGAFTIGPSGRTSKKNGQMTTSYVPITMMLQLTHPPFMEDEMEEEPMTNIQIPKDMDAFLKRMLKKPDANA